MHESPNAEMAAMWNGASGQAWLDEQPLLDRTYEAIETLLADVAAASGARSVLDIGCGTGATTLAIARRLGPAAEVTGVDISEPLIALARRRAEKIAAVRFVRADAQIHAFEPASFDLVVSRFGVMFFDDPIAAFANLHRAAKPVGEMRLVVFRSVTENPFMTTAERAAAPLLPGLGARQPDAPGQFAFADPRRISTVLGASGWTDIDIRPIDVACALPEPALLGYLSRLGPVGLILQKADDATRSTLVETVRAAFDPYVHGTEVRFSAACWMVGARSPARTGHDRQT
jgi:SAM-dependent methyltransferase